MARLSDLSVELIFHIVCLLDPKDIIRLQLVCKSLYRIVRDSNKLQYILVGYKTGYDVNPRSSALSIVEGRAALQQRNEGWTYFKFQYRETVQFHHHASMFYDLSSGVYVTGVEEDPAEIKVLHLSSRKHTSFWSSIKAERAGVLDVGLAVNEHDLIVAISV